MFIPVVILTSSIDPEDVRMRLHSWEPTATSTSFSDEDAVGRVGADSWRATGWG